jgi:DNA-binding MarR family transcriptional regulator
VTKLELCHQGKPAVTKTVQHLVKKGYLDIQVSKEDKRIKYHFITKTGLEAHQKAIACILPDAQLIFAKWSVKEVETLHQSLFRLKNWLDDHRDTVVEGNHEA